jgi:uncharacterized protein involved in tolerance to divalent cations
MKDFTLTGTSLESPSALDVHVLNGWRVNTLRSYNSAVIKFLKFAREKLERKFKLPATEQEIYQFYYWDGRTGDNTDHNKILGATLKKYLHRLKVWHTYHSYQYPYLLDGKVKLILRKLLWFGPRLSGL